MTSVINRFLLSTAVVILLQGCASVSTPLPTQATLFATSTLHTKTTAPSATPLATKPPLPTMSNSESELHTEEFLRTNGRCRLPCVWGISPGKTQYANSINFFNSLSWRGSEGYGYYSTGKDFNKTALTVHINIYARENTVERLNVEIGGKEFINRVGYFSFRNILQELGEPSEVLVSIGIIPDIPEPTKTSFELFLYYAAQNVLVKYTGVAVKNKEAYRVCPSQPNMESEDVDPLSGNVSIYAGVPNQTISLQELVKPFWIRFDDCLDRFIPIEEAFEIDINNFYKDSQENENTCFYSKLNVWQNK